MNGKIPKMALEWKGRFDLFLRPHYPRVAVGMEGGSLVALRLGVKKNRKEKGLVIEHFSQVPIPKESWSVSFTKPNILSPDRLGTVLGGVLDRLGVSKGDTLSLLLPDNVARVNLLAFSELPLRKKEILPLIRFRLQKTIPFRMEDAVLAYQILQRKPEGECSLLAVVLHRKVLRQYEDLFRAHGVHPGLVDLSSLNLLNLCRHERFSRNPASEDWLLVNFTEEFLTVAVVCGEEILFFRSKGRPSASSSNGSSNEWALRELRGSLSYYRERLGGKELACCVLRATTPASDGFLENLPEATGTDTVILNPIGEFEMAAGLDPPDPLLGQRMVPLIGMGLGRKE